MKFEPKDYTGKVAMLCNSREDASRFTKFLHENGYEWCSGSSYLSHTNFVNYVSGGGTCYSFNEGRYGSLGFHISNGYRILKFEDFEWDEPMIDNIDSEKITSLLSIL